jgi:hypothetical protein
MSHSYPIWNEVNACIYSGKKSYGAKDTSECTVYVGTSKSNSVELVRHVTTRRTEGEYTVFRFGLDCGQGLKVVKTLWMKTKTQEWFETDPTTELVGVPMSDAV